MAIIEGRPHVVSLPTIGDIEQVDARQPIPPPDYSLLRPTEPQALEPFPLCDIISETEMDPAEAGIPEHLRPRSMVHVEMHDPQLDAVDPDIVWATDAWIDHLCGYVRDRKMRSRYTRLPGKAGGTYMDAEGNWVNGWAKNKWGDQQTREDIIQDLDSEGVTAWLETIPTGRALEILVNIGRVSVIENNKGKRLGVMDELGRAVLTAAPISVAIRHRFSDEAYTLQRFGEAFGGTLTGRRIHSYGSGSAPGPMKGAQLIRRTNPGALDPGLALFDIDPHAAEAAETLARGDLDFRGDIEQHVGNILNPLRMAWEGLKLRLTGRRPDIGESDGFWEYIDREQLLAIFANRKPKEGANLAQRVFHAVKQRIMVKALAKEPEVAFLKMMYKSSKRFVTFSQMLDDGPHPEFLDAFGWGLVVRRSYKVVLEDIKKAGIPLDQVEVRKIGDGTTARYIIDKKAGMSRGERFMQRAKGFLGKLVAGPLAEDTRQAGTGIPQKYNAFATYAVPAAPDINDLAGLSR